MKAIIAIGCFLLGSYVMAQDTYDIRSKPKKCNDYQEILGKLPVDVRFSVNVEDGNVFVYLRSKAAFERFFNNAKDGIAIDIVSRDQYVCGGPDRLSTSDYYKGSLQPPLHKRDLLKRTSFTVDGYVVIHCGKLPPQYDPDEVECNLLVLQKRSFCDYISTVNVPFENWDILEMGLYRDSISDEEFRREHIDVIKSMKFTIPFEWNQGEFDDEDIRPLYDSLHLTDYNIRQIFIDAYTSIEGTWEINQALQEKRANSIVKALQAYQTPEIESVITTQENWLEFYGDMDSTDFTFLLDLEEDQIKKRLSKDQELLAQLEPLLAKHRKAEIEVFLEKRFTVEERDPDRLRSYFNHSIQNKDLDQALYLQQVIFTLIDDQIVSPDILEDLEIPPASKFGPLLNSMAIREVAPMSVLEAVSTFRQLHRMIPESEMITYNLAALKLSSLSYSVDLKSIIEIERHIRHLEKRDFNPKLIARLRLNLNMLLANHYDLHRQYKKKNRVIKEIRWLYSRTDLSDADRVRLAKFLANYSAFRWAREVLEPRIHEIDASEDLLYYYIRLTFSNSRKHRDRAYQSLLTTAIHKNRERFCGLFLPKSLGGYTFQMLGSSGLKARYCEHCEDSAVDSIQNMN